MGAFPPYKMNTLFHITPVENVLSIFEKGIRTDSKLCGITSGWCNKNRPRVVWLTDDVDYIVETQLTEEWCDIKKPVVLTVDVRNLEIEIGEDSHQFQYHRVIFPKRIKQVEFLPGHYIDWSIDRWRK